MAVKTTKKLIHIAFILAVCLQNVFCSVKHEEVDTRITSLHIKSDIKFRFATTMVSSRVKNFVNETRKARFLVNLPNEAFITEFLLEIGGDIYPGEIKDKRTAKKEFEEAVSKGQTAGYIGNRETNQFFVEVSLAAFDNVTFNLTYQELLIRQLGRYDHRIYVDAGRSVEDISIIVNLLEYRDIEQFSVLTFGNVLEPDPISVNITDPDESVTAIYQPSANSRSVQYFPSEGDREKGLTGEFVVQYDVHRGEDAGELLVVGGHFIHFFAPVGLEPIPRDVVFILDISGSMFNRRIDQLKKAMHVILDDLNPGSNFNILTFSDKISMWRTEMILNTDMNRNDAKTFVDALEADGGTNILRALQQGIIFAGSSMKYTNRSTLIFFLTDGEPTDGKTNKTEIITLVQNINRSNKIPIFTLAFGSRADYKLMRKISLQNNGMVRRIYEAGDAENQIAGFYKEISETVLKDVGITYPTSVDGSLTKTAFTNYFKGTEKVIAGKIKSDVEGTQPTVEIHVGAANGNLEKPLVIILDENFNIPDILNLTTVADLEEILEKSWAYLKVKQLLHDSESSMDETEKGKINKEILDTSLRYGFVTPLTSMVVTKPEPKNEEEDNSPQPRDSIPNDSKPNDTKPNDTKPNDKPASRIESSSLDTDDADKYGFHSDMYSEDFDIMNETPMRLNKEVSLVVTVPGVPHPLCFNTLNLSNDPDGNEVLLFKTADTGIEIRAIVVDNEFFYPTAILVRTQKSDLKITCGLVLDKRTGKTSLWRNIESNDVQISKHDFGYKLKVQIGNEMMFLLQRLNTDELRVLVNLSTWNLPINAIPTGILGEMLPKVYRYNDTIKDKHEEGVISVRITYPDIGNDRGAVAQLQSLGSGMEATLSPQCYMVRFRQQHFFENFRNILRRHYQKQQQSMR